MIAHTIFNHIFFVISRCRYTACFVLGYEDSLPLLETYQAEAVFVTEDKEVIVTDGLKDMFTLTDSSYEQVEE